MTADADIDTGAEFSRLILVGGCGSTGSTLLAHLLSRHPAIGSGPEFNCFNHPELYDIGALRKAWPSLRSGRAAPAGYIDVPVFMTHAEHFQTDHQLVAAWLADSRSSADFVRHLQRHLRGVLNCDYVLEKSPSNAYCFRLAQATLAGVRIVHLIRDGRDVVVSLMRRQFNLFGAGSRWLYDTLRGLEARSGGNYCEVRYESLVSDADQTIGRILQHAGVEPEQSAAVPAPVARHKSGLYTEDWTQRAEPRAWNQTPADPISTKSVGQYRNALSAVDLSRLYRIRLRPGVIVDASLPRSFGELLDFLDYARQPDAASVRRTCLRDASDEVSDYWRRLRRFESRNQIALPRRLTTFSAGDTPGTGA